jgi:ATP synthase protein I
MTERQQPQPPDEEFRRIVVGKSQRRNRARSRDDASIWSYLGTFGLVGWTVALPTLLGLALGLFLDGRSDPSGRSYTITFLVLGVAVGCGLAWYWVRRESRDR